MQNMNDLALLNEPVLDSSPPSGNDTLQPRNITSADVPTKETSSLELLNKMFPEQKREDKSMKQARAILGGLTDKFSSAELEEIITIFQYLTESWLDMWEREKFDGKTLNELLNLG